MGLQTLLKQAADLIRSYAGKLPEAQEKQASEKDTVYYVDLDEVKELASHGS